MHITAYTVICINPSYPIRPIYNILQLSNSSALYKPYIVLLQIDTYIYVYQIIMSYTLLYTTFKAVISHLDILKYLNNRFQALNKLLRSINNILPKNETVNC